MPHSLNGCARMGPCRAAEPAVGERRIIDPQRNHSIECFCPILSPLFSPLKEAVEHVLKSVNSARARDPEVFVTAAGTSICVLNRARLRCCSTFCGGPKVPRKLLEPELDREAGGPREHWTCGVIGDHSTDGRDWCRICAVANAPTGCVRKRRTAVLIRSIVFVVLDRALL